MRDRDKNPFSRQPLGPLEEELIQVMEACERMLDGITAEGAEDLPQDGLSQLLEAYRQPDRKNP